MITFQAKWLHFGLKCRNYSHEAGDFLDFPENRPRILGAEDLKTWIIAEIIPAKDFGKFGQFSQNPELSLGPGAGPNYWVHNLVQCLGFGSRFL